MRVNSSSKLTRANFSDADIRRVWFEGAEGFSAEQLYSTRSYKARDLTYLGFGQSSDLRGWSFVGQNLSHAWLLGDLTGADVTDAVVNYAILHGLAADQLYSTASYKAKNLAGINLSGNNMTGWNFGGQNLRGAGFSYATLREANLSRADLTYAQLTDADLSQANLTNAILSAIQWGAANLSGADTRGSVGLASIPAPSPNVIKPDGTVMGLRLDTANPLLIVRDYDGTKPIPVHIMGAMTQEPGTVLQVLFQDATWGSTISFDPGIPVSIHGDLELGLAAGVDPASLVGTSFQVFDWTGVTPEGQFNVRNDLPTGYGWDASHLYTTGSVLLTAVPEPASLALLAFGVGLLWGYWYHRRVG